MSRLHSTTTAVLTAILLALSVGLMVQYASVKPDLARVGTATAAAADAQPAAAGTASSGPAGTMAAKPVVWAASAPGRIEPRGGEIRIGTQVPGRIAEVLVQLNDRVTAGDLMVRIDDEEAQAKMMAAEAEAAVRKRERDAETVGRLAQDRRSAEDSVANADRALFQVRRDLDRALANRRSGTATEDDVVKARAAVTAARERAEQERVGLRRVQATAGMPLPTRLESALIGSRAELLLVETSIERARVRATADGTVLQVAARAGETVAPSPELALVVMGDLSALRVRAEVEERDVNKVRLGQKVVLRSDAYPGRDFAGTVTVIGQSLAPPRLPSRGPRRPTDVDALEVMIDVEGAAGLLPGMRTDVFFSAEPTVQAAPTPVPAPAVKAN
jgi:HlyD family secretion protein